MAFEDDNIYLDSFAEDVSYSLFEEDEEKYTRFSAAFWNCYKLCVRYARKADVQNCRKRYYRLYPPWPNKHE